MIDLKQLIQIAPYPEDVKAELAGKIPGFSDDQKRDLENLSWNLIRESYETKVAIETQAAITDIALGKKTGSEADLGLIADRIFDELTSRIEGANANQQIEEVREKLQTQTSKAS